jgi:hypothetical protein
MIWNDVTEKLPPKDVDVLWVVKCIVEYPWKGLDEDYEFQKVDKFDGCLCRNLGEGGNACTFEKTHWAPLYPFPKPDSTTPEQSSRS